MFSVQACNTPTRLAQRQLKQDILPRLMLNRGLRTKYPPLCMFPVRATSNYSMRYLAPRMHCAHCSFSPILQLSGKCNTQHVRHQMASTLFLLSSFQAKALVRTARGCSPTEASWTLRRRVQHALRTCIGGFRLVKTHRLCQPWLQAEALASPVGCFFFLLERRIWA